MCHCLQNNSDTWAMSKAVLHTFTHLFTISSTFMFSISIPWVYTRQPPAHTFAGGSNSFSLQNSLRSHYQWGCFLISYWKLKFQEPTKVQNICAATGVSTRKIICLILLMHVGVNELQWGGGAVPTKSDYNWKYKPDN